MNSAISQILSSLPKGPPSFTPAQLDRHVRRSSKIRARLLIALRRHLGLTHEEAAARAGISPSTVRTQEAASPHAGAAEFFALCTRGLGFDPILVFYENERRDYEAGNVLPGTSKPESEARVIKGRCDIGGQFAISPT